jgi:hypothetical protein
VENCVNCFMHGIAANGAGLLYQESSSLFFVREPGTTALRVPATSPAALSGDGRLIVATVDGDVVRIDVETLAVQVVVRGQAWASAPWILAPGMWVRSVGGNLTRAEVRMGDEVIQPLKQGPAEVVWTVPGSTPLGTSALVIDIADSPFRHFGQPVQVQQVAPRFITEAEAGIGNSVTARFPVILHADTGLPVRWFDPARPGELLNLLMTGLNDRPSAVEWSFAPNDFEPRYRLLPERAEPHPANPYWTVVQLRMPVPLQAATCTLAASYQEAVSRAIIETTDHRAVQGDLGTRTGSLPSNR